MGMRYYITLGAKTTAGGAVTTANHPVTINGAPVALEKDECWCPRCNSQGVIALDGPRLSTTSGGREIALSDDLCMCKCNPPPRLVANQDTVYQTVNADWHSAKVEAVAETAAKLNGAGRSSAPTPLRLPLVLLDWRTEEPYRNRRYKLELKDKVIEGVTDQNGATCPLTAAERATVVMWHIVDDTRAA